MTTATMHEVLAAQPAFRDLGSDDIDALAGCARNARFDAGALLAREGGPADGFYLVSHGRLAIEMHAPGASLRVDTAGPGELAGWSWLFSPHIWTADVRAIDTVHVVAFDGRCLRERCQAEPTFGYRLSSCFNRVLIHRLEGMRLRVLDLYGGSRGG